MKLSEEQAYVLWAINSFILGVIISYPLNNPPAMGGILTFAGYWLVDRLLVYKETGSFEGYYGDINSEQTTIEEYNNDQ